jgi:prophage regulatory protein
LNVDRQRSHYEAQQHVAVPAHDDPQWRLARLPTVLRITGLGRSTNYRWVASGSFPPPVRLGPRAVAWRWSDLDEWTRSRASTHPH